MKGAYVADNEDTKKTRNKKLLTFLSVPGVIATLKIIQRGTIRVEDRVNHQPRRMPHHG